MKWIIFLLLSFLISCSPKGPQTYDNYFVGKTKQELIDSKGVAREIRIAGTNEIYIYSIRQEFFGKKEKLDENQQAIPKKIYIIETIYYINKEGMIYKYQVWKKKVEK